METAKIERINELYRKSKAEGLTEEEKTPSESIKAAVAYFAMLLPLGSLGYVLFCTKKNGWGWNSFLEEINQGEGWIHYKSG